MSKRSHLGHVEGCRRPERAGVQHRQGVGALETAIEQLMLAAMTGTDLGLAAGVQLDAGPTVPLLWRRWLRLRMPRR